MRCDKIETQYNQKDVFAMYEIIMFLFVIVFGFFAIRFLIVGIYGLFLELWSFTEHSKWEKDAKPSLDAMICDIRTEKVQYVKNGVQYKTTVCFTDGFMYISHETEREDHAFHYNISLSDRVRKRIIEDAKEEHERKTQKYLKKQLKKNSSTIKLSDAEWEDLYKTNYEEFWEMVLKEGDLTKLPNSIHNYRSGENIYGEEARNCLLRRLKSIVEPSGNDYGRITSLLEIKHELKEKYQPASMLDAIREYESRYIRY